jgi:predicted AlkP superfamily phosphohydrolase/phosphomutase
LKGRQPQGIVEPGQEYEQVIAQLVSDLWQLIDPVTGECPIKRITRTSEAYGPGAPDVLPDLFITWKAQNALRTEFRHPKATIRQGPPAFNRGSDHTPLGLIAACGPAIEPKGNVGEVDSRSLVPQFKALLAGCKGATRKEAKDVIHA